MTYVIFRIKLIYTVITWLVGVEFNAPLDTVITEKYMIMFIIYVGLQYIITVSGKLQQYCSI